MNTSATSFRVLSAGSHSGDAAVTRAAEVLRSLNDPRLSIEQTAPRALLASGFSSARMFDAARTLRERLGQNDFPAIISERTVASLTHTVTFYSSADGFQMIHRLSGARGPLTFYMRHDDTAGFYAYDCEGRPHSPRRDLYADEFKRAWREEGDDALFARLSELYSLTMPEATTPAYILLGRPRGFRDWSLPEDAEGARKSIGPGVYSLRPTPPPAGQCGPWLQIVDADLPGFFGGSTVELRGLEEHDADTVSLVRVRTHYSWLPETNSDTEAAERESRDGQPFTVISFTGDEDGHPEVYLIQFADGFMTTADVINVEYI